MISTHSFYLPHPLVSNWTTHSSLSLDYSTPHFSLSWNPNTYHLLIYNYQSLISLFLNYVWYLYSYSLHLFWSLPILTTYHHKIINHILIHLLSSTSMYNLSNIHLFWFYSILSSNSILILTLSTIPLKLSILVFYSTTCQYNLHHQYNLHSWSDLYLSNTSIHSFIIWLFNHYSIYYYL